MDREREQITPVVLDQAWHEAKYQYIAGYDPYESAPKNWWHKLRKFLGWKYKTKESKSLVSVFRRHEDGTIESIK